MAGLMILANSYRRAKEWVEKKQKTAYSADRDHWVRDRDQRFRRL